jgi:type II secretory pathway component PulF
MSQPNKPDPLPYRPPPYASNYLEGLSPLSYSAPLISLRLMFPMWMFGTAALGFLVFVLPQFERIFKDFKTELPGITKVLLAFGRWVGNDYGWVMMLPIVVGVPFAVGWLLSLGGTNAEDYKWRRRWASLLSVIVMGLIALLIILALFAPMISLIQSVSGGSLKK